MPESISDAPAFADSGATGVAHRIVGTTMPVLEVELQDGQSVVSQGGELSWMSPHVQLTTATAGAGAAGVLGVLKRVAAGGTVFLTRYQATGASARIAFAAKMPGQIRPIPVDAEHEYLVSRHGFLAATADVTLALGFQQKLGAGIFSGNGFLLQRIAGHGTAWIELSGELITYRLAAGETLLVHPGHIGLFDASVRLDIQMVKGIKNIIFGAETLFLAQLTGPGEVHLQSLTLPGLAQAIGPYLAPGEAGKTGFGGLPFNIG